MKPVHNNNGAIHRDVLRNVDNSVPQMDAEMKEDAEPIQALYPRLNNNNEDQFEYVHATVICIFAALTWRTDRSSTSSSRGST